MLKMQGKPALQNSQLLLTVFDFDSGVHK